MGWSYSPLIAQSLGWTLLLAQTPESKDCGFKRSLRDLQGSEAPPSFVELWDEKETYVGFCTIFYELFRSDNSTRLLRADPIECKAFQHSAEGDCNVGP
jgi:hypothetical protein